jgi:hypothetical protein
MSITKKLPRDKYKGYDFYDSSYALGDLLKYKKFNKFYSKERRKIKRDIYFLRSKNMQSSASYGYIDEGFIIATPYAVVPKNHAIHIAHEIEHLIYCEEGYKQVFFNDERMESFSRRNKMLNDMIYDPLINLRLQEYNFNVKAYLEDSFDTQTKTMLNTSNSENIFLAKTLYVKYYFDYKNLNSDITEEEMKFNQWVTRKYPDVIRDANKIIHIIEQNDVTNKTGIENIYNEILELLNLKNEFILREA